MVLLFISCHFRPSILQRSPHAPLVFIFPHYQEAICEESRSPRSHNIKNGLISSYSSFCAIFCHVFFKEAFILHHFSSSHIAKKPFLKNQEGQKAIISRMDQYYPILHFMPFAAKHYSEKSSYSTLPRSHL